MRQPEPASIEAVSVFGLGKLGLVLASSLASRGIDVVGVDLSRDVVDACRRGVPNVREPGLEQLMDAASGRFSATTDGARAVRETRASMILVPTPSGEDGGFLLDAVLAACDVIGAELRHGRDYHLVVIKSTVLPGACRDVILPRLERASGRRRGRDLGLCYNPEFVALGSAVRGMQSPELVLIGESDSTAGGLLVDLYDRLLAAPAPIRRMSLPSAELAKLSLNSFVTTKITFANLLAQVCERMPGADVDAVTEAIGLDSRIGGRALVGGLGFGGPCFPRDNRAIRRAAATVGLDFPLASAVDAANREIPEQVAAAVEGRTGPGSRIALLGLSYKPDTPVADESQALMLARALALRGLRLTVYDPMAMDEASRILGDAAKYAESAESCVADADCIVIATPWPGFRALVEQLARGGERPAVIDCCGLLNGADAAGADVHRLGTGRG